MSEAKTRTRTEQRTLSRDDAFELLSNSRRRYALHYLKQEAETDLGGLSEQVAAWETDSTIKEISAADRKRVYTSLQQFHLPKLDEHDVVDYDSRAGTVELGDAAQDLDIYLEVVEGQDIPWSQYYLGLSGVSIALVTAVLVNAWPFSLLSGTAVAVFVVTAFLLSSFVHTYYSQVEMRLGTDGPPPDG